MGAQFDIERLIDVAVADERSGMMFYSLLAEKSEDRELKKVFSALSGVEEVHAERFASLKNEVHAEHGISIPDGFDGYLENLVARGGERDAFVLIDDCITDEQLVNLALSFEHGALDVQKSISGVLGSRHRDVIDNILQEERDHVVTLSKAKQRLLER